MVQMCSSGCCITARAPKKILVCSIFGAHETAWQKPSSARVANEVLAHVAAAIFPRAFPHRIQRPSRPKYSAKLPPPPSLHSPLNAKLGRTDPRHSRPTARALFPTAVGGSGLLFSRLRAWIQRHRASIRPAANLRPTADEHHRVHHLFDILFARYDVVSTRCCYCIVHLQGLKELFIV
jgi:hypothetical protein